MTIELNTTRRGLIGAGVAAIATGAVAPAQAQGAAKTFVLVHGAWHGAWCWRRVSDLLEKKGHKAFVPTMAGLGACSHLLNKDVNLTTHITDIVNLIKWENISDIVLVGHSYGGVVITQAGNDPKVAGLVYIAAFAPDKGESVATLIANPAPGAPVPPILPPQDGFLLLDREKFAA